LYKIRNNGKPKTIAVIGAADKRNFVLRELSEQYQMLLFDKDPKALSDIYDSLWQTITILISKNVLRY
jgi:hypothetical protein